MSLNGLDNPAVIEAYQIALTEAGGWFLLRYVSRDEVILLDRGTGGVPDVRSAIDGYEETSPLYGFLQYRRRKVVLSYLPEGISRLIQARTAVQFQSILDKFSPHDTVFKLTKPTDLTESALSSACLLHTASGSITSSSSSLRRRRLMEIAEDAEENTTSKVQTETPSQDIDRDTDTRQRSISQLSEATIVPPRTTSNEPKSPNDEEPSPVTSPSDVQVNGQSLISWDQISERPSSRRTFQDELSHSIYEPRMSSQSARPSLRDLEYTTTYTPKVKRGPRPSVDRSGRPRTAGSSLNAEQRPIASLPAGVRSSSVRKNNPSPSRPRSQGSSSVASISSRKAPPVPPLLVPPLSMPISRPQLSPGAKSLSALSSSGAKEKERLMKALQMRKSQMEKQKRAEEGNRKGKINEDRLSTILDANENKENIGDVSEKAKHNKGDDKSASVPENIEDPFSETQPSIAAESIVPHEEEKISFSGFPKPDSAVHILISDPHGDQLSNKETADDNNEFSEKAPSIAELETEGSVDSHTKSGTGSPSAAIDVPLENQTQNASAEEIAQSPPRPEKLPVPSEQEVEAAINSTESVPPQSIPLPCSPPLGSRPNSPLDFSAPTVSNTTEPQHDLTPETSNVEQKEVTIGKDRRRPYIEPIQVPTPEYSDDDNLSDDSFMEELKSATVEEAKPVSVGGKSSPLSPAYSSNGNGQINSDAWRNSRVVSNPSAIASRSLNMQALAVGRSVSDSPTSPVLVAKKINVSSGISKRIKALEKFSNNRDTPSNSTQNLAPIPASSFDTLLKRASVSLGGGNSDASSTSKHTSHIPEAFSRASSVRRRDSQSSTNAARTTGTISVTARIIRDSTDATPSDSKKDLSEPNMLNLHVSPLTVEHETPETPLSQNLTAESATDISEKRRVSTSSVSSGHQSPPTLMSRSESRLSISSILSKSEEAFQSKSSSDLPSSSEEKKGSRASRLLRRMSSITSNPRKSVISALSPSVKEEESVTAPSAEKQPQKKAVVVCPAIDFGEINVQFPDTLLWKRRFLRLDDKGYLILTPGNVDSTSRNMIKRYHLSEFRTPCLPDADRQELPHSILLDFLNGSTLQCACETRQGQALVLQTLIDAHSAHQQ